MNSPLGIGLIGCGSISSTYLDLIPLFQGIRAVAVADLDMERAQKSARTYPVDAVSVEELLARPDVDVIVNLTVPAAHHEVSLRALAAGKHVYSEKPLALTLEDGRSIVAAARKADRHVCAAPDTFLGGAHQQARKALDAGRLGQVTSGTAHIMSSGMEAWHPDPDFFFAPGGGPVLDMGPYYLSALVDLLGPVRHVSARAATPKPLRTIGAGPRKGQQINVRTPTTLHAILEFANGALVTLGASWDVVAHGHSHVELYGETGTMILPDPNFFGGEVRILREGGRQETLSARLHPLAVPNQVHGEQEKANYRGAGLADMAHAIRHGKTPRCGVGFALHVLDIMLAILTSAETGISETLTTSCERPEPLGDRQAADLLDGPQDGGAGNRGRD